eukprot:gene12383-biopygen8147
MAPRLCAPCGSAPGARRLIPREPLASTAWRASGAPSRRAPWRALASVCLTGEPSASLLWRTSGEPLASLWRAFGEPWRSPGEPGRTGEPGAHRHAFGWGAPASLGEPRRGKSPRRAF